MSERVHISNPDWGNQMCKWLEDIWKLSVGCNTVIYTCDGQCINAHSVVLMAASPLLMSWLRGRKERFYSVEIGTINHRTWMLILQFMYSGEVDIPKEILQDVHTAAVHLQIKDLSKLCEGQLSKISTCSTSPEAFQYEEEGLDLSRKPESISSDGDTVLDFSVKQEKKESTPDSPSVPMSTSWHQPQPITTPTMNTPMNLHQSAAAIAIALNQRMPAMANFMGRPLVQTTETDPSKKHICNICGKGFRLRHVLQQHVLTHSNYKPYECNICGFRARQKAVIWKHKKLRHGENREKRNKDLGTAKMIKAITEAGLQETVPKTPIVIEPINDDKEIEKEQQPQLRMNVPNERVDQNELRNEDILSQGEDNTQNEEGVDLIAESPKKDGDDSTENEDTELLLSPQSPIVEDRPEGRFYLCRICSKAFKNKHILFQHEGIHSSARPYSCEICGFRAKQKAVIWRHKKVKHPFHGEPTMVQGYSMVERKEHPTYTDAYVNEMLSPEASPPRTRDGRYLCAICNKSFKNKHILSQHKMIHSNLRPYKCDICGFRAKQKSVIYNHKKSKHPVEYRAMLIKGPVTDYPDEDDKDFDEKDLDLSAQSPGPGMSYSPGDLSTLSAPSPSQVPVDSGYFSPPNVNDLTCHICYKSFRYRHVLQQHILTHSSYKPYTCTMCGFRARQKSVIWRHLQSKHSDIKGTDKKSCMRYEPENPEMDPYREDKTVEDDSSNGMNDSMSHQDSEMDVSHSDMQDAEDDAPASGVTEINGIVHIEPEAPPDDGLQESWTEESLDTMSALDKPFACDLCPFRAKQKMVMWRHRKYKHPWAPPMSADDCDQLQGSGNNAIEDDAPTEGDLIDPETGDSAEDMSIVTADGSIRYACDICNKTFSLPHILKQHKLTHSEEKTYKCDLCPVEFRQQPSLCRHRRVQHGIMSSRSGSPVEGEDAEGMDLNKNTMSLAKTYPGVFGKVEDAESDNSLGELVVPKCPDMSTPDSTGNSKDVSPHKMSPSSSIGNQAFAGINNNIYMAPGMMFPMMQPVSPAVPSMVQQNGGGDKKHSCNVCGRGFRYRHVLEQHLLTHTDLRPYSCEFCGFSARQKASLWRHKQKHAGEKPPEHLRLLQQPLKIVADANGSEGLATPVGGESPIDFSVSKVPSTTTSPNSANSDDNDDEMEEPMQEGDDLNISKEEVGSDTDVNELIIPMSEGKYSCKVCNVVKSTRFAMFTHASTHKTT